MWKSSELKGNGCMASDSCWNLSLIGPTPHVILPPVPPEGAGSSTAVRQGVGCHKGSVEPIYMQVDKQFAMPATHTQPIACYPTPFH